MGTLMSCPNLPDKLDTRFREALGNAKKWKTTATELTLLDDKDTVLARFEAVPR
ncbi:MAG: META domain-containing protein [Vicinamibacterales bacterium]